MLSKSKIQPIILTSRIYDAETFYGDVLGLEIKTKSDLATVFDVDGADLVVAPVDSSNPSEHTVLGFSVHNIDEVVESLQNKGLKFERFEQFTHQTNGLIVTPDGDRVIWFRDPDGNLLSIVQYSKKR